MRIVIDTNIVISATFFGGSPLKVINAVIQHRLDAYGSAEMLSEYGDSAQKTLAKQVGKFHPDVFSAFMDNVSMIKPVSTVNVCRDPDDNKFLACAKDAKALYLVSGDKDLLVLREFEGTEILTVAEFCARYPNLVL